MIVDKSENIGEHAWTKLLDDKDANESTTTTATTTTIVRMSTGGDSATLLHGLGPSKDASPLSSDHMTTNGRGTINGNNMIINNNNNNNNNNNINNTVSRNGVIIGGVGVGGVGGEKVIDVGRKESLLGTFHRHLRRSLKAVSESPGPITRYRQTRFSSRRVRKRVIFKHGDCNVVQGNVAKRRRRYLQDIFTTLVDAQWRWTLLVFALSFLISWAFFGAIWWLIAYAHGDLDFIWLRDSHPERLVNASSHTMCVTEVRSLTSAFLYSIETQHTIGYGNRYVTEECPEAIFTMCLQCITGVFIQAFMVGIVFAKLSRPKKRAQTLLFSRNAVICHRDGVPCLMFRVGDMRKSHIIEAHVRAQIIRKKVTKEGEVLPFYQQELTVGADGGEDRLMFIWPTTIVHKIDRNSPLYMLSASDMLKERFEVVCILEGVIESTGMTTQARSSYLPTEILWGHRFVNVVSFRKETGEYEVDYTLFNNTYDVDTPLCSSKQLDEVKAEYAKNVKSGLERALSVGLLQQLSSETSVERFDPASDESLDSGRLPMRSNSTPNGILLGELQPLNISYNNNHNNNNNKNRTSFTVGDEMLANALSTTTTNLQSINEKAPTSTAPITNNNNNNNNSNNNSNNNNSNNNSNNNNNNNVNTTNNNNMSTTTSHHYNNIKSKTPTSRRLSIKHDPLPIDSIC